MRALVAEDDPKIRRLLEKGLKEAGYAVAAAADGEDALQQALGVAYDVVVLDLGLPRRDGLEVLRGMRLKGRQTPVLLLTARDGSGDRVRGLDAGADDYLVKPFSMAELLARLRALSRRGRAGDAGPGRLAFADLEMDLLGRKVRRAGREVVLTNKEFALLELLLRSPGEVLSRSVISESLWDDAFESFSNVIDVHVRRLRAKVDLEGLPRLIQTVKGVGYVLRPD